jgi:transposase
VCPDHPVLPSHNNTSELRLRLAVTGRKKNLFAGSKGGAASAAILYSIIASRRLHRLDPWVYLYEVLGRINETPINR